MYVDKKNHDIKIVYFFLEIEMNFICIVNETVKSTNAFLFSVIGNIALFSI